MPYRLLLPLILFVLSLAVIGRAPLATKGEAREALVVRNMVEQQNYVLPLRNMEEIPSKPPLFHWTAAAVSFGNVDEFSVRFPSVLFSSIALLFFGAVLAQNGPQNRRDSLALVTLLICATSFEWLRSSQSARVDMAFSACLLLSSLSIFQLLTKRDSQLTCTLSSLFILCLSFAGAILSKGPAGGVLPLVIGGVFALLQRDLPATIRRSLLLTLPIFLGGALAGLWYYQAWKLGGQRFLDVQLLKENISRLTGDGKFEVGHEKPFYFGPLEMILAFLPWSLAIPLIARDAWRERGFPRESLERFSLIAVGLFLVICSIATSKRPVYFLPIVPFLAFLTARSLFTRQLFIKRFSVSILCGAFLAAIFILPRAQRKKSVGEFSAEVNHHLSEGTEVYQIARSYYPTLFYSLRSLPTLPSAQELPAGALGIIKEGELDTSILEPLYTSTGKADDGQGKLVLVRKR